MNETIYNLLKEICPDFSEYKFLKTDLYKGKIIGGHNLYYKLGEDNKEGIILGKKDIEKFDLNKFRTNFITFNKFDRSDIQEGWTGEEMIKVLNHIKEKIK